MQCMQPLWKKSKYSYFYLALIRVEHLAKQTFKVVCQSTAAVFVLIIISLVEVCVCSLSGTTPRGTFMEVGITSRIWAGLGSCLECLTPAVLSLK